MGNEIATLKTASELLSQAADELSGGNVGRILKFSKGKYFIGDDEIKLNAEMIAHATQLARGWVKHNGSIVKRHVTQYLSDGRAAVFGVNPENYQSLMELCNRWSQHKTFFQPTRSGWNVFRKGRQQMIYKGGPKD